MYTYLKSCEIVCVLSSTSEEWTKRCCMIWIVDFLALSHQSHFYYPVHRKE